MSDQTRIAPNQQGVTLLELMVAMTLGLIILGTVVQVFAANKQSFRFSVALERLQEDGRFAIASMARDLRMAGYIGCSSRQQLDINTVAGGTPPNIDLGTNAILGFDNGTGWTPAAATLVDHLSSNLTVCNGVTGASAACQVSDVVQVVRGAEAAALLTTSMANLSSTVRVRVTDFNKFDPAITVSGNGPGSEDLVLITDCQRADLFRVTASGVASTDRELTPNAALQHAYQAGSTVTPLVSAAYFVATDGTDSNGDGNVDPVGALYRLGTIDGGTLPVALPIAKGVELMRVTYGVDTGGDEFADAYVNATGVTDWSRVVSARIALLVKSRDDFITDNPTPITFVDGTVVNNGTGADRRLRIVVSTTVGLRNRVP